MWSVARAPRKPQSSSRSSSATVLTVRVSGITANGGGLLGPLHPPWLQHLASHLTPPAQGVVYPVRIESSSASLANGHTLDLNCLVASQTPHTITWYKRGGSLPSRHQVWSQQAEKEKLSAPALTRIRKGPQHLLCAHSVVQQPLSTPAGRALDQC